MSNLLKELEAQRHAEERAEMHVDFGKLLLGAEAGVILGMAAVRVMYDPTSLIEYVPALGGALPGLFAGAAIMDYRERHPEPLHKQVRSAAKTFGHEIIGACRERAKK